MTMRMMFCRNLCVWVLLLWMSACSDDEDEAMQTGSPDVGADTQQPAQDTSSAQGDASVGDGTVDDGDVVSTDSAEDEPDERRNALVFVSSHVLSGDSVPRADAMCTELAMEAGLGGTWMAWVSTSEVDAIDKLVGDGPWSLVDGTVVFDDRASLSDTGAKAPISTNERGEDVGESLLYTGTGADGRATGMDCAGWRSYYNEDDATVGRSGTVGHAWTQAEVIPCGMPRRMYCFEQQP
ncbi:MAG: hypothetical protein AAFS10_07715 [Myxococcota bacterium]